MPASLFLLTEIASGGGKSKVFACGLDCPDTDKLPDYFHTGLPQCKRFTGNTGASSACTRGAKACEELCHGKWVELPY